MGTLSKVSVEESMEQMFQPDEKTVQVTNSKAKKVSKQTKVSELDNVSKTKVSVTKVSKVIDSDLGQTKVSKTRVTRTKISTTDKSTGGETAAQAKLRAKILAEQSKPIEAKKSKKSTPEAKKSKEIVSKDTKESGRKTRQSKADKFKDSETAKLWANVPESKGNIHILRKHLYCTKLNLTTYFFFFFLQKLSFIVKTNKKILFQHYLL